MLLLVFPAAHAESVQDVLARTKTAGGGAAWDSITSWRGDGTMSAGGLSGTYQTTIDAVHGRSVQAYTLGPIQAADGYDGQHPWSRDPGGEVSALDAPESLRHAVSQAWLDAHAYWFPQRILATYAAAQNRDVDGHRYTVIEAHPQNGDPLSLWFAADTGMLARAVQIQGADTATTDFDDYRDVSGARMPFHIVTDLTDSAGRTDPRRRVEVRFAHIEANVALTDAVFALPAMAPTAHIDDVSGSTVVPFDLVSDHIYVDGQINGQPARFLVDTGGVNLLTPEAAKKFGIVGEGKLAASGVGEQRVDLALAHAKNVRVGTASLDDPVFYIIDLGALAAIEGVHFDGLVGYEMFRRFGVQIDYARHTLTLSEPGKFAPPPHAIAVPFELNDRTPVVSGALDGVPMRISIDTGSRSSLTLHSPFVRKNALAGKYHAAPMAVTGWGVGGAQRGQPARLGTLRIGDADVVGVAADLYGGDKGSFANPDIGGNLGGGVLHRFTVGFDYAKNTMYLAPNADAGKPDPFDRSGLWLIADGDALRVVDAAPGSAAEKAGIKVDDRLLSIDGEPVKQRSLNEWRRRLRDGAVGSHLTVHYRRGSGEHDASLTLADRIPPVWKP